MTRCPDDPMTRSFYVSPRFLMKAGTSRFGEWSEVATSEDVINAMKMLGNPNEDNWRAAWKWMAGLPLEKTDLVVR